MLWESVDAEQALRDRFGLESRDHAADWLTAMLAEHWDLAVQEMPRLTLSDRNAIVWVRTDRGPLVVKLSCAQEQFAHLAATAHLLRGLAAQDVPVAAPLPSRNGQVRIVAAGPLGPLSLAVLPEITGDWLDAADLSAVRAAGAALAGLHEALHDVLRDARSDSDAAALTATSPHPLPERVSRWLDEQDRGLTPAASARLAELITDLPAPSDAPQLIHGDFRAANLLVRDGEIAAVLDFDDVRTDHRVVDLAQASTYLATLFRDWGPTPAPTRAALRAGYESVRPLSDLESRWLEVLTLWMGIAAIPPQDDGRWAASASTLALRP